MALSAVFQFRCDNPACHSQLEWRPEQDPFAAAAWGDMRAFLSAQGWGELLGMVTGLGGDLWACSTSCGLAVAKSHGHQPIFPKTAPPGIATN